jgi:hypothetical protein
MMTNFPEERPVFPDDPTPEWADKTGRLMTSDALLISTDWIVTPTSPTTRDQSRGEYSAGWAKYLARATVQWEIAVLTAIVLGVLMVVWFLNSR